MWSDPTVDENEPNDTPNNEHDIYSNGCVKRFGTERIYKFMSENGIDLIIRTNEPVMEGCEKTISNIVTVFSATDYCGSTGNAGSII